MRYPARRNASFETVLQRECGTAPSRRACDEVVLLGFLALEDPEQLAAKGLPFDAVEPPGGGVRSQARPDRRDRMVRRPVDQIGERRPIGLAFERGRTRFGTGDDQPGHIASTQRGDRLVKPAAVIAADIRARHFGQREQPERYGDPGRRGGAGHQVANLPFGSPQGRVGHVVDKADDDRFPGRLPGLSSGRWTGDERHQPRPAASSAWSRSAMMSSACSMPMLSRIVSGRTPALLWSAGGIWRCVVEAGWQASDFASPRLTSRLTSFSAL